MAGSVLTIGRRYDSTDFPVARVGEKIGRPNRSLADGADALSSITQVTFLLRDFAVLHNQTHQATRSQRTDEDVALPASEQIARVENHAGGRDHRIPIVYRLFHPFFGCAFANLQKRVVGTVGDDGPAVIFPRLRVVQLVTAPSAMFHSPELSGLGMERGGLDVAMAVRPDLRPRPGAVDKRVIAGRRAVRVDAHDFAERRG